MSALRKVLVVDDDAVVGKSFSRVLSAKKGYVVTTAANAHEALKQMREQTFDVVFTDIKMPGMDGVELAQRVRASHPWTPVVIITGNGTTENEARAKAAGVIDFMRKPLSPEMIEGSAANALCEPAPATATNEAVIRAVTAAQAVNVDVHIDLLEAHPNNFKNIALFMAAPFIGLAYALLLPLVGMAMLAWIGGKALLNTKVATKAARQAPAYLKNVALFLAAPFIGLVYAVALPFVGIGMIATIGVKALLAPKPAA
jgi:CheY-like chemotaxis protein